MKKVITTFVLVTLVTTCLTGCSSNDKTSGSATIVVNETTTSTTEQVEAFEINTLGKLYQLDTNPVVSGVSMRVNFTNEYSEYNNQSPSKSGIRSIFEVNEQIFVTMTCPEEEGELYVKLFPHNESSEYYREFVYIANDIDEIYAKGKYNDDGLLNAFITKSSNPPGYYDVVFIKGEKPVAVVMIKLYGKGEIDKTGKTPQELMNEENSN